MLKVNLSKILLFVLLTTLTTNAFSRKFYFSSSTGNDSYTTTQAQNTTTPWKTLQKLQIFGNNGAAAGDTFLFKRGDLFDNGYNGTMGNFGSMKWWSISGYTCPSGTPTNPIVFTSYGDPSRPKPNFLFPFPSTSVHNNRYVLSFEGISNVVIDGLQFNDFRFSDTAKVTTAYTSSALLLGEYGAINTVSNFKVTNCIFNRVGYAMLSAGRNFEISYNIATNLKSVGDTSGGTDIGADFMVAFGPRYRIHHNFVSGCWYYTSGTGGGKGGGVFEVGDNFDSSFIGYNTFIDNDRCFEGGSIFDPNVGCNEDTIAYNKFINNGGVSYLHQGDVFGGKNSNWHFWNNVIVENAYSRFSGPNFGSNVAAFDTDTSGNINVIYGQSFWNFPTWGGGNNGCGRTTSRPCGTSGMPLNPSIPYAQCNTCNNGGSRVFQYTSDSNIPSDTLYDIRNNVIWYNNNLSVFYDSASRPKFKHRNNILKLSGGSTSGGLSATDILTTSKIFVDTANSNPFYWDFNLTSNSPAINTGTNVGLRSDFNGNSVSSIPDIGILEFGQQPPINPPPTANLVATATQGTIACNGATTTITVSATGGTTPYSGTGTYTVSAGTYNYYVADAAGNRDTVSVVVTQPSIISVTVASGTITTPGGTTSIQINATGGAGTTYKYSLNGTAYQTSNIFVGVTSGNHLVNVKDVNGCIVAKNFTIADPIVTPLIAASTYGTISCNGGTTIVTVSASGGVSPYTGTGSFTVTSGTRSYSVTDAAGNTASTTVNISQPSMINVMVNAGTISVFGGSTTITVTANGGTGTLVYKLNNGAYQTSNVFNNVLAGTHTITVKDLNNCTKTSSVIITQPASIPLNATAMAGSILCNGSSTSVTVSATGGTAPYTGTGTFSVVSGTYAYTITDASGNTSIANITITEPQLINITLVSGNITSSGGSTSITVNATGGVSPYTYKLNNGAYQSSNIFSGVTAGSYLISVKDVNGCIKTKTIVISEPSALNVSATSGTIACYGGSTIVTITANGGTSPYTGIGQFTVLAGTYNYNVSDANGNTQTATVTVTQPTQLNASLTTGIISAFGGSTSITASVNGGTSPYSYSLNNGAFQTSNIFNNVIAGVHNVLIKDANGCTIMKTITINQPANNPIIINAVATQINCYGSSTIVTISATGGTAPYTGTGIFSATAGTRSYTVRDAAGNSQTTTISISQPTDISLMVSVASDISVIGGTTSVSANATGGAGSYRYSLDAGATQTSNTFRTVGSGTHFITIVDANGCSKMATFNVNQVNSTGLVLNLLSKTDATCKGGKDGKIEIKASGGREPYNYSIGNGNYQISNRFNGLRAGAYRVFVKDANNNIVNIIVVILDGKRPCTVGKSTVTINTYPNPTTTSFKLAIDASSDEQVYVEVMDLFGRKLYQEKGGADKVYNFGQNFNTGSYFVRVTQGEIQTIQKIIKQ